MNVITRYELGAVRVIHYILNLRHLQKKVRVNIGKNGIDMHNLFKIKVIGIKSEYIRFQSRKAQGPAVR